MDLYETAYLCGGRDRVALVALVRAAGEGRIAIAPARHRVTAGSPASGAAPDPVEAAVLAALPATGALLGELRRRVARSDAVADVRRGLAAQGLLLGGFRTPRGRRRRAELDPGTPPERVAVLGEPGIADERLRRIFTTPDPDLAAVRWLRRHPVADGRDRGGLYSPSDGGASGYDGGGGGSGSGGGGW
ncbi:TIGR04222 domain-containing membrane protein [Actinomadura logoneensis]|uniref:TIGR04222 domain-containing membrane protein n=2 Tax=Actinomadura logoneensis TaxID=2293572 RepID=A0A372JNB6_9ACTN|nr:TIGR04222 domain-containing membrane protein [Actinomadura logoneensis]